VTQQTKSVVPKSVVPGMAEASAPRVSKRLPSPGPFELAAIDMEGTLLRADKSMSKRCAEAIKMAVQRDVKVVLASSGAPASLVKVYQSLGLRAPQICFNGAVVYDPSTQSVLFHDPIPAQSAERIVRSARTIDNKATIKIEVVDERFTDDIGTNPDLSKTSSETYHTGSLGAMGKVVAQPVTKISLTSSPQYIVRIKKQIELLLKDQLKFLPSEPHILQMVNSGVGKGTALMQIADHLRIDPEHVIAMGDGLNDLEMIQWAGMGIAMGNAHKSIKEAAHFVGPSNQDDGVAIILAKYVLRGG